MAHFYGKVQGNRGVATRCGDKNGGINGSVSGWNIGIEARMHFDPTIKKDVCRVYLTNGSSGYKQTLVGEFVEGRDRA